jgi:hypothetical protein
MIKRLAVSLAAIVILGLGFNHGAWAKSVKATSVQSGPQGVRGDRSHLSRHDRCCGYWQEAGYP